MVASISSSSACRHLMISYSYRGIASALTHILLGSVCSLYCSVRSHVEISQPCIFRKKKEKKKKKKKEILLNELSHRLPPFGTHQSTAPRPVGSIKQALRCQNGIVNSLPLHIHCTLAPTMINPLGFPPASFARS